MKQLHLHWLKKSFMLCQCTVHGGLRFSVQGPRATDFFWQWACGPVKACVFFFFIKPHASQPGCLGWWMSFLFAKVNVLSITFWWLPEDLQSKRHSSSERLIFLFRTMTNKDNISSLFNRNFLKYVPNSIYKYLQKRKFNIMIKLEISFSVRTSLSCLRFFSIVIAAYISHCSF